MSISGVGTAPLVDGRREDSDLGSDTDDVGDGTKHFLIGSGNLVREPSGTGAEFAHVAYWAASGIFTNFTEGDT